jgi:hypothetical protein
MFPDCDKLKKPFASTKPRAPVEFLTSVPCQGDEWCLGLDLQVVCEILFCPWHSKIQNLEKLQAMQVQQTRCPKIKCNIE